MTFITIATSATSVIAVIVAAVLLYFLRKRSEQLRAATAAKEAIRAEYTAERDRLSAATADARRLLDEAMAITASERTAAKQNAEAAKQAEAALAEVTLRAERAEQALAEATAKAKQTATTAADEEAARRLFARELALRRSITAAIELLMNASASPSAELLREEVASCISSLNDALTKK